VRHPIPIRRYVRRSCVTCPRVLAWC
jgi:hypothetical protein